MEGYSEVLHAQRAPLHNRLGKALVNAKDAQKYSNQLQLSNAEVEASLGLLKGKLNMGRPIKNQQLDEHLQELHEIGGRINLMTKHIKYLEEICERRSMDWTTATLLGAQNYVVEVTRLVQQRRDALFEDSAQIVRSYNQLLFEQQLILFIFSQGVCQVCFDKKHAVAFICGHQLCGECYQGVFNSEPLRRNCPFCRGPIRPAIFLKF